MALSQISAVIDRLHTDDTFRVEYCENPDQALSTYRLSGNEVRALKTGDGLELELMGLGQQWEQFVNTICGTAPAH
jgi:hypothetical protein